MKIFTHPVALVALGVVIGVVFKSQISKVPGVSKLPSV
jgi:hypothetical protein